MKNKSLKLGDKRKVEEQISRERVDQKKTAQHKHKHAKEARLLCSNTTLREKGYIMMLAVSLK